MKNEREYDLLTTAAAALPGPRRSSQNVTNSSSVPVATRIKESRLRKIKQCGDFFEGLYKDGGAGRGM
jgi:hypothetical protein